MLDTDSDSNNCNSHSDSDSAQGTRSWLQKLCKGLPELESQWLLSAGWQLLCIHSSGFHRRVLAKLKEFPFRLLRLCHLPGSESCSERKQIARDILVGIRNNTALERNALKFGQRYWDDLQKVAATGKLTPKLEVVLAGIKTLWRADVRENERINKCIALLRERAPNISDDLQSSRTMLKHFLGQAGQGLNRSKWSSFKASVQSSQNVCMSAWDGKEEVMSPQDRFAPPTAPKGLPSSDVLAQAVQFLYPHSIAPKTVKHAWATCYNMMFNKHVKEMVDGNDVEKSKIYISKVQAGLNIPCMCFGTRKPSESRSSFTMYMCIEKVRTVYRMVPCTFTTSTNQISINLPLTFVSSTDAIAAHYEDVMSGSTVGVFGVDLATFGNADDGLLTCARAKQVYKIFQLNKPKAKTVKTLEKVVRGQDCSGEGVGVDIGGSHVVDGSSSSPASASIEPTESTDDSKSFEKDMQQGLQLFVSEMEELGRPKDKESSHSHEKQMEHELFESTTPENLLSKAASVFLHFEEFPEEVEANASSYENICREETGEDQQQKFEAGIVKEFLEANSGQTAPEIDINKFNEDDGLSPEEATTEALLNIDQCLGNMNSEHVLNEPSNLQLRF